MERVRKLLGSRERNLVVIVLLMIVAIVIFSMTISGYLRHFQNAVVEENSNYLTEIGGHIALNVQTVVENAQTALTTCANSLADLETPASRMAFLEQLQKNYTFDYVGYAFADGNLVSTAASEDGSILTDGYFQQAMAGQNVLKYVPLKLMTDRAVSGLQMAVPIYDGSSSQPVGVLVALLDMKTLGRVIGSANFGGQGHTYIIDMKGEILLHTKRMDYSNLYKALRNLEFRNSYTLDDMIRNISAQQAGFAIYSDFGVEKYLYYRHLGVDSWTIVNVVETEVITAQTKALIHELTIIGISIIILFPALLFFAVLSYGVSNSHKQAAEAKTAFLANMSHEIRTPMNAIVGISEILLRENITGKQKNYVLSIVNAGNGLLTIINDILDISKIESGKFNIVEEEYELESLIYDIITIVSIKIADKPIEFMVDTDPALPKYVIGDMIRVKQILLNIIGNAVKFTHKGYIKFSLYAKQVDGELELTMPIEDTGSGIQKKDMAHLFESFNQVDTHKNHSLEGTGLGLVISKRLCEMMDGTITIESEYGKGSTFTITLRQKLTRLERMMHLSKPENFHMILLEKSDLLRTYYATCMDRLGLEYELCTEENHFLSLIKMGGFTHALAKPSFMRQLHKAAFASKTRFVALLSLSEQAMTDQYDLTVIVPLFTMQLASVLQHGSSKPYQLKRAGIDVLAIQPMPFVKVLLVDDNEVNLQVANGLMNPYYMQVDCALSGAKAIEMIKHKTYDLVFMDHMMPEMDGTEAVRIIRNLPDPKQSALPIVALTANVTHDAKDMFLANGFDDFLAKPIETVKLNAILKKWLKAINDRRVLENPHDARAFQQKIEEENRISLQQADALVTQAPATALADYVDFDAGLHALGSAEVYSNILDTYARTSREKLRTLPYLLQNDLKTFTVEIHGLKGASAGICAVPTAKTAARLEELAKQNKPQQILEQFPAFLCELQETLSEIDCFLHNRRLFLEDNAQLAPKTQNAQTISGSTLASFQELFLNFDTENLKILLDAQQAIAYPIREEALLEKLSECYHNYDFDSPIQLLEDYECACAEGNVTQR